MTFARQAGWTAVAGLVAGIVVLGIGGRVAMRVIALAGGLPPQFDVAATLEVLAAGAWRGVVGAAIYVALARFLGPPRVWTGAATGLVLFAFAIATLRASIHEQIAALDVGTLAGGLFGAVFLAYGITVHYAAARLTRHTPPPADL